MHRDITNHYFDHFCIDVHKHTCHSLCFGLKQANRIQLFIIRIIILQRNEKRKMNMKTKETNHSLKISLEFEIVQTLSVLTKSFSSHVSYSIAIS